MFLTQMQNFVSVRCNLLFTHLKLKKYLKFKHFIDEMIIDFLSMWYKLTM